MGAYYIFLVMLSYPKKALLILLGGLLLAATPLVPVKMAAPAQGHYARLQKLSGWGTNAVVDAQRFDINQFRRLAYTKLRTVYLTAAPASFKLPAPPANSSAQTRAELDLLLELQAKRTSADSVRYMQLATVYHDPFTVAASDADYDRNNRSLFVVGQPLGSWYTYRQCPQTLALLDRVIQDATYYVFSFKQQFSRPRPYNLEPRLKNYEAPGHASYPSGHSSLSYVNAYVLEELAPELKAKFYANAAELAYSREVIGVHYPSDSEVGRVWAREFVNRLLKTSQFRRDLALARAEIAAHQAHESR